MNVFSHADLFEVLCLQLADEGRGQVLLGDSLSRVSPAARPFLIGESFPDCYLEFPLAGDPFLDVTILYNDLPPDAVVDSPAAQNTSAMLSWYATARKQHPHITCGFELDTKEMPLPPAAIHFQPREQTRLVRPFCETIGEPERAELYLNTCAHMPKGWLLSFFGMFRGRPGSPLRVCGYLSDEEKDACASDSGRLAEVFDAVGFTAYDDAMIAQVSQVMAAAPKTVDFQFDVHCDGSLGETFSIDVQFGIERPELVRASFERGPAAQAMALLEEQGAADGRWRCAGDAAFARALPARLDDGSMARYVLALMPQWAKARWTNGALQPSKLYCFATVNVSKKSTEGQSHRRLGSVRQ